MGNDADHTGSRTSDAGDSDDLRDVVEEVTRAHGDQGAGAMADELRDRTPETEVEPEDGGDVQS